MTLTTDHFAAARLRLATFYANRLQQASQLDLFDGLAALEADLQQIIDTHHWLMEAHDTHPAARDALVSYAVHGQDLLISFLLPPLEAITWMEAALPYASLREEAQLVLRLASGYKAINEPQQAADLAKQARSLFEELNDLAGVAECDYQLGEAAFNMRTYEQAKDYLTHSLAIFGDHADDVGIAKTLRILGHISMDQGQTEEGQAQLTNSLEAAQRSQNLHEIVVSLTSLGYVKHGAGDFDEAVDLYQEALALSRDMRDKTGEAMVLARLGGVYIAMDEHHKAIACFEQSMPTFEQVNDVWGVAYAGASLGTSLLKLGRLDDAHQHFSQSLATCRELSDPIGISSCQSSLAHIDVLREDYTSAKHRLTEALHLAQQADAIPFILESLVVRARLYIARGYEQRAARLLAAVLHQPALHSSERTQAEELASTLSTPLPTDVPLSLDQAIAL